MEFLQKRINNWSLQEEIPRKLARSGRLGIIHYDLDEVKRLEKSWKEEFRKDNRTDDVIKSIGRDKAYEAFCKEIDDFILGER